MTYLCVFDLEMVNGRPYGKICLTNSQRWLEPEERGDLEKVCGHLMGYFVEEDARKLLTEWGIPRPTTVDGDLEVVQKPKEPLDVRKAGSEAPPRIQVAKAVPAHKVSVNSSSDDDPVGDQPVSMEKVPMEARSTMTHTAPSSPPRSLMAPVPPAPRSPHSPHQRQAPTSPTEMPPPTEDGEPVETEAGDSDAAMSDEVEEAATPVEKGKPSNDGGANAQEAPDSPLPAAPAAPPIMPGVRKITEALVREAYDVAVRAARGLTPVAAHGPQEQPAETAGKESPQGGNPCMYPPTSLMVGPESLRHKS